MATQAPARPRRLIGPALWSVAGLLRALGIGVLAGLGAGFVAGGVGSRLAMKIVALTAGPAARGQITENGNRIGAFTADTGFLLFFGTFLGVFGGLLYVALRPWLPASGRRRGLVFGALLLAACGRAVVERENFDFHRFGLPALNVALFAALFLLFGLVVAPLADRADRAFPPLPPNRPPRLGALGAYALLAGAALLGLFPLGMAVGVGLLGRGEVSADFRAALVLFLALLVVALLARALPTGAWRQSDTAGAAGLRRGSGVMVVLAIPVVIGLVVLLSAIGVLLAAA
jgi:hypothetical protein